MAANGNDMCYTGSMKSQIQNSRAPEPRESQVDEFGAHGFGMGEFAINKFDSNTINVDENSAQFKAHLLERIESSYDKANRMSLTELFDKLDSRMGWA